MDASDRGLSYYFKGHGAVANYLTGIKKCVGEVSSFAIEAEYTRVLKCPHRWKSKGLRSGERGGCTSNVHLYELLSLVWCGERTPEVCPSIFVTPCILCQGWTTFFRSSAINV
jgi:hypothetical protein